MKRWKEIKQKLLPRSLYGRSLMIIVLPILLMQLIVTYVFIDRHWDSMSGKLVESLSREIRLITEQVKRAPSTEDANALIGSASHALDLAITIENKEQAARHVELSEDIAWYSVEAKLKKSLTEQLKDPFTIAVYPKDRIFEVSVRIDSKRVLRYLGYSRRLISPGTYIFIMWLIGSSIVLMVISVMFMRNQIRPIHRLAIAAEKLGKGQEVSSFKVEGAREVRQAARAFIEMQSRIRRQIDQRTAMLAGVSHDLRTPLTRMKLQLAMLKKSPENENFQQDIEEMEKMLEGYLTFARGEGNEATELIDMQAVIERIVNNARRLGFSLEAVNDKPVSLRARPVAIERAIGNIVTNACKYAKHAWLDVKETPEAVEIFVDDDGPGIPEKQREDVFKPFYRLEKSRNLKTGGVGLGLSIAQDIVHSHGGEIALDKSPKGGLRVVIRLPV